MVTLQVIFYFKKNSFISRDCTQSWFLWYLMYTISIWQDAGNRTRDVATAARCATNELYMYAYPLSCTLRLWLSDLWWTSRRGIMWWHPGRGGWAAGYTVSDLWWTSRRGRMWWDSGRGGWAAGYIWPVMNQPQRKNVMRPWTAWSWVGCGSWPDTTEDVLYTTLYSVYCT